MNKFKELDIVKVIKTNDTSLPASMLNELGTIVHSYSNRLTYEVEFYLTDIKKFVIITITEDYLDYECRK